MEHERYQLFTLFGFTSLSRGPGYEIGSTLFHLPKLYLFFYFPRLYLNSPFTALIH